MQQHSVSPHSMHRVRSPPGLTMVSAMDVAALPGPPLWLTRERDGEQAIAVAACCFFVCAFVNGGDDACE